MKLLHKKSICSVNWPFIIAFAGLLTHNALMDSSFWFDAKNLEWSGLENIFWTYSSCGASGLNFSLVLTPVELVLKSGILKETKHIIQ